MTWTPNLMLTAAEIDAAKTSAGGWPRETLAAWGVPWPPPGGWRKALIAGKPIPTGKKCERLAPGQKKPPRKRPPSYHEAKARRQVEKRIAKIDAVVCVCVECGGRDPELVGGEVIYPHRPDLWAKKFRRCACGAYVGCHPGTDIALGHPAGPLTQRARREAHAAFDPLWKRKAARDGISKGQARDLGYAWLAGKLGIDRAACHIGWMDRGTALQALAICVAATKRPDLVGPPS